MKCTICGAHGAHLEWRLTAIERSDLFRWATGIPLGVETEPSEEVQAIRDRMVPCTLCDGSGLFQPDAVRGSCAFCPCCHGLGGAVDGDFRSRPPGADIATVGWERYHGIRRGGGGEGRARRVRGELDVGELDYLKSWLRDRGFHEPAVLIPAMRDLRSDNVVIGSTCDEMIEAAWRSGNPFRSLQRGSCGFIDLEEGRFLDPERAMELARERGLLDMPHRKLRPEWLPYHRAVPCGVITWWLDM
jgi:hypothetical protein